MCGSNIVRSSEKMNFENTSDSMVLRTPTNQNMRSSKVKEGLSIRASKTRRFGQSLKLNFRSVPPNAINERCPIDRQCCLRTHGNGIRRIQTLGSTNTSPLSRSYRGPQNRRTGASGSVSHPGNGGEAPTSRPSAGPY